MSTPSQWLHACPLPRSEARMLLQCILGCTHVQLLTRGGNEVSEHTAATAQELAYRRIQSKPMTYILGEHELYGYMFRVNPGVLIPRPGTEHLVEVVLDRLPLQDRVWDLGIGNSVVAVSIVLERPDARAYTSDVSVVALHTAAQSAATLGADIEFALDSWFDTNRPSEKRSCNITISNPPYVEADNTHLGQGDLCFEPQSTLTDFSDGFSCIHALAAGSPVYLRNGGWLPLEHGCGQGTQVRAILAECGFSRIDILPDLTGLDRVTLGVFDHGN